MKHALFGRAAERYDLHTPPHHYQHDHQFVLELLNDLPSGSRLLDVGCGTGVFLERALEKGLDACGIDATREMVTVARRRVGPDRVEHRRMQDLTETSSMAAVVSLCWSFNYCRSMAEATETVAAFHRALVPGGILVLQVAHAPHATGELLEDREPGPDGTPDDVLFLYRFHRPPRTKTVLWADYVYACRSLDELVHERHELHGADVLALGDVASETGFDRIEIFDDWHRRPLTRSISPFLVARKRSISP